MADVRKPKNENSTKPRVRSSRTRSGPRATIQNADLKRLMLETQDQLALIHGVLEELCERQEALSAWQMEFSKRLVTLQEAQWRSLEDLAGIDMGDPVSKAFGVHLEQGASEEDVDGLNEANKMMEQVNTEAMSKRVVRLQRRKDPLRSDASAVSSGETNTEESALRRDSIPDSVFVVPTKVDVH